MASIDEQLKNVRTLEDIVNLLTILFTNLNNQNELYYNMFLNPVEMYLDLERYDENGKLVTVTLPNVAMMRRVAYVGSGNPNGQQSASVGSFYVDQFNNDLYFKASSYQGEDLGWYLVWSQNNLTYLAPDGDGKDLKNINANSINAGVLGTEFGGTGTATPINGLVKGQGGALPYIVAEDGIDYLGPDSFTGIICWYPVYDETKENYGLPAGWLRCDGTPYEIVNYQRLYNKIGDAYTLREGEGAIAEGSFCVPDLTDMYIKGWDGTSDFGTTFQGHIPAHVHEVTGDTAIENEHKHDKGTMNIVGYIPASENVYKKGYSLPSPNAFSNNTSNVISGSSPNDKFDNNVWKLNAASNWTGSTGTTSHKHGLDLNTKSYGTGDTNEVTHMKMVPIIKY